MPKFARPNSYNGKQSNQSWTGQARAATASEAAAGDSTQLYISPSTLASAVGDLVPSASATVEGVVYLTEGISSIAYPVATKFYADNLAISGAPAWSETVSGIGQLATTAEAQAGSNDNVAMTPLKTVQLLATPPAIGGTTPAAGSFTAIVGTTMHATGLITGDASATITTGATALNLASDASTGAVNIGTGAGARTITVGNVTGATAVAINTGTGSFTVTSTGTGDIVLNSADTVLIDSAGVLELNSSAGVIGIGNDAVAQNINIGTGAAARVITMGNSSGATQVVINGGTAGVNVGANAIAQTVTIGNQTGASAVVIDSGTGPITIGTAIAKTITIGNTTGATGIVEHVGTGNYVLDGVAGSTYTVGASTTTGTITIGGTAQTGNITLGSSSGTNALRIGNGSGATTLSLCVVQTAGAINMGTAMTTGTITVGGTGAHTGTIAIAPGTGAQTVNIATSTGGKTVAIATGAGANAVTLGSTNTTSATTINAGSGGISLQSGQTVKVTSVATAASPYAVLGSDFYIACDVTAGILTITLPAAPATGRHLIVSDSVGQSGANTITIDGNGKNISLAGTSAATKTIATAYKAVELYYNGTLWNGSALA